MPWDDTTWDAFCSLLEHGWPGEFSAEAGDAYRALLGDREPAECVGALRTMLKRGQRFRPSAAELTATITADPSKPTWPEALSDLRRALRLQQDYFASTERKEARCSAWLREHSHELVACFFEAQTYERLRSLPIDDPDYGQLETKRLAEQWEAFVGRAEERVAHGLPVATGTRKQLGPRKPDFAGVLTEGGPS